MARAISRAGLWLFSLVLLAAPWQAQARQEKASVPDWVKDAAKTAAPEYKHNPDWVLLLDDEEYTVLPNGQPVMHERIVKKILRPQGRGAAEFFVWYDKDSHVDYMHVWSIGPDGREYALKDNEFRDVAAYSFVLYQDDHARAGTAQGADAGAVVAEEYQEELPSYLPEITWSMNGEHPAHLRRLTLHLPDGFKFDSKWKQHEPVAPTKIGGNDWQWTLEDTPGLDLKDVKQKPVRGELLAYMSLHYSGKGEPVMESWQALGQWYAKLAAGRADATPEITAKAQQLVAEKSTFYDKAETIQAFVRDQTRYVAIEIGIGGLQPHAAADIYKNMYGDCKDKATLLISMLGAVGIHATWLDVDTEHRKDVSTPTLEGDHMIAAIEIPAGYDDPRLHSVVKLDDGRRYLITDPTWSYTPFGQIEDTLQGTWALLVDGAKSQAIQIPVMPPDRNTWTRTAHFKLSADGTLNGKVTERLYGDVAAETRGVFGRLDEQRRMEVMEHYVNSDLTGMTLANVKMENLEKVNSDMTLSYDVTVPGYAKQVGALLLVRPRVLGSVTMQMEEKRHPYPVNLHQTLQEQDEFTIEIPDGYSVDELPDAANLDVGFASYTSKTAAEVRTIHYERNYTVGRIEVPAESYPDLRRLMSGIVQDERANVVLRKVQ